MKRTAAIILALCIALALCACGGKTNAETESQGSQTEATNSGSEPEASSPAESAPVESSNWKIDYYVDDFGDPTDKAYLVGTFSGKFSNTATTGSDLTVLVYYEDGTYSFRLLEYGSQRAFIYQQNGATLKTKINGEISQYNLLCYAGVSDLYLRTNWLTSSLKDAEYDIACVIEAGNSKYSFTMNGAGFAELLEGLNAMSGDET